MQGRPGPPKPAHTYFMAPSLFPLPINHKDSLHGPLNPPCLSGGAHSFAASLSLSSNFCLKVTSNASPSPGSLPSLTLSFLTLNLFCLHLSCWSSLLGGRPMLQDLGSLTREPTVPSAVAVSSLNHWITKEVSVPIYSNISLWESELGTHG